MKRGEAGLLPTGPESRTTVVTRSKASPVRLTVTVYLTSETTMSKSALSSASRPPSRTGRAPGCLESAPRGLAGLVGPEQGRRRDDNCRRRAC